MIKSLSVFFPAYNEEDNISSEVEKALTVLKALKIKYEVLIIDDGSKDQTPEIADQLAKKYPTVRVVHQLNGGYGSAVKRGFYESKMEWVVYTDSDNQFDFSEVSKFLEKTDSAEVIWGYRIKRADLWIRKLFALGWKLSLFVFFGLNLKDVDCGFKMVRREVFDKIPKLESTRGGMVNAELAIKARKFGFKIAQVGVTHYPRKFGKPSGANLGVIIQSYLDLFKLWQKLY